MASGEGRIDAAERNRGLDVLLDVPLEVVFREPAPALAVVVGFFLRDVVTTALGALMVFFFTGFLVTVAAVFFFFFDGFFATFAAGFLVVSVFLVVEVFFFDFFVAGARVPPAVVRVFFLVTFFLAIATILNASSRVSS